MNRKNEANFEIACKFIIKLAKFGHASGVQSRKLERYLAKIIQNLGYDGIFRITPESIEFNFIKGDEIFHYIHTSYMNSLEYNLAEIEYIYNLVSNLDKNKITLSEAYHQLDNIVNHKATYWSYFMMSLGYFLSAAGFAGFLRCNIIDMLISGALGLVTYCITLLTQNLSIRFTYAEPFLAALIVSLLATAIKILRPELNPYLVTLSAIIYLIPGFTISCGIIELSYKYVISGLINLTNGIVCLIFLFAGTYLGVHFIELFVAFNDTPSQLINSHWVWPSAMVMAVGLCIAFKISIRNFLWAILGVLLTCLGINLGLHLSGVNLGNLIGTVIAVVFSSILSDILKTSQSAILLPSIVFLVSGSIGFRGFVALSQKHIALAQYDIGHMFVVALCIAAGLILGNIIYQPRISL